MLLDRGVSFNSYSREPTFEAHRTVSTTSSIMSRKFLQESKYGANYDPFDSRPSTSESSASLSNEHEYLNHRLYQEIINPQDIIDYMQNKENTTFIYLVFSYPPSHVKYDPFKLRAIPFGKICCFNYDPEDPEAIHDYSMDYFTVFKEGMVRLKTESMSVENTRNIMNANSYQARKFAKLKAIVNPGDQSFEIQPLDLWLEEFNNHKKLMKMKTFSKFRIWKAFYNWKINVRQNKIAKVKKYLEQDLYILNPSLRPALLNVRQLCHQVSSQTLCKIEENQTYSIHDFYDQQSEKLDRVKSRFTEFRDVLLKVVKTSARSALLEKGFTPDDQYLRRCSSTGQLLPPDEKTIDIDSPDKMTYTQQATKRQQCKRLTSFIRLCDYIVVDSMHRLTLNSIEELKSTLSKQNVTAPSHSEIASWVNYYQSQTGQVAQLNTADSHDFEDSDDEQQQNTGIEMKISDTSLTSQDFDYDHTNEADTTRPTPLYQVKVVIDNTSVNNLQFVPNNDTFLIKINRIIEKFEETCKTVTPLVNDVQFESFTKPLINRKFEQKTCGEGPQLYSILEDDNDIAQIKSEIESCIKGCEGLRWRFLEIRVGDRRLWCFHELGRGASYRPVEGHRI